MTAGIVLLAAALALVGYNAWDSTRAGEAALHVKEQLEEQMQKEKPQSDEENSLPEYLRFPDKEMPAASVDGEEYIGILEIPALQLELPVMSELNEEKMKIAPCRYQGSVYQDNLIIGAHNYDTHFGRLQRLNAGDEVLFTDMDGNCFRYSVIGLESMHRSQVEQMVTGDWDLTLFTCVPNTMNRLAVRCVRK